MAAKVMDLVRAAMERVESIPPDRLAEEARRGDVTIVDVREKDEWDAGHIPGAIHVPRGWLEFKADPSFFRHDDRLRPEARIVTHCRIGYRGALAAATLRQMGYDHVANLEGGLEGWANAGYPVVTD